MKDKLIVKVKEGKLTLNGDQILDKNVEIEAEAVVDFLSNAIRNRDKREEEAREKRQDIQEDIALELDGRVIDFQELQRVLKYYQTPIREAWKEDKRILYVGFGLNDGDLDFTASAEWR